MKSLFIFILLFSCHSIYSQSTYLSRLYNLINGNEYGTEVLVTDNGYFLLSNGICDPGTGNSTACIAINFIDKFGEIVKRNLYINRFRFCPGNTFQLINDTICVCGYNEFVIPRKWAIHKYNFENDSVGIIYPEYSSGNRMLLAFAYQDNHYYLAGGFADNFNVIRELIVVKTDASGNAIKEVRFHDIATPNVFNISHAILDLQKTADGNFIICTYTGQHSFHQPTLVKFDEDLNIIWQREFTRNYQENNIPDITPTSDSGVVISWGLYVRDLVESTGNLEYYKYYLLPPTIHKLDKYGNTVWSDTLWTIRPENGDGPKKDIYMLTTAHNGDIIGVGTYDDFILRQSRAWMFRYNKDGKKLWEKIYQDSNINSKYSFFLDVAEAENGDIVCTGEIEDDDAWGGNADYTWLLRVDSLGCMEPGCGTMDTLQLVHVNSDMISDVGELNDSLAYDLLFISPNPASLTTRLFIASDNYEHGILRIHNLNGSLIWSLAIDSQSPVDLDTSVFVQGVYVVEYVSYLSGVRDLKKLVIIE